MAAATTGTPREGKELRREPLMYGNTDVPYLNESSKLRSYLLAPDAETVRISNASDICEWPDSHDHISEPHAQRPDPVFEAVGLDDLLAANRLASDLNGTGTQYDGRQDARTFDSAGQIVRLVFASGC